jgi:carboxymethylenebutenolidase
MKIESLWQHTAAAMLVVAMLVMGGSSSDRVRAQAPAAVPAMVQFPSADGRTTLIGFVYTPTGKRAGRAPAVVLMHGRAGPYSINVKRNGPYNASTLSKRHKMWGESWSALGYVAVLVDSFAPRGFPGGFGRGTINERPEAVNEVTVRPLDAYGALAYLRSRPDVAGDRIGLQGWSNGGSAALAAMAVGAPGLPSPATGFRAALVFYAGCGLRGHFDAQGYRPYAPVRAFHGTADEETSPERCRRLVERSRSLGGDITLKIFQGARHGFDDPGRQNKAADRNATADAMASSQALFERILAPVRGH